MSRNLLSESNFIHIVLLSLAAAFLAPAVSTTSCGDESDPQRKIFDTTFTWRPYYGLPESLKQNMPFYVGGRFVGFGEKGFKAAIEKFKKLPGGTSVVWGPDCGKMSSSADDSVLAEELYPDLWKDFKQIAKERGIILSSNRWPVSAEVDEPPELPDAEYIEPGTPAKKGEIILKWKPEKGKYTEIFDYWNVQAWPVYYLDGKESGRGPDGFLATLKKLRDYPAGSRLRIVYRDITERYYDPPGIGMFNIELRELIAVKKHRLVIECPKGQCPKEANCTARCRFTWRNFRSLETPHKEVVYLVNGKVMGRGDEGFDNVLEELRKLPPGSLLEYPCYFLHAQAYGMEEREAFEAKNPVPFKHREVEFMNVIRDRGFVVDRDGILYWPKTKFRSISRFDEEREGDWFLESLLRFAVIVRGGAEPSKADVVISWKQDRDKWRNPISKATYLYNGEKIGAGTSGFLAALQRLESLDDGATVRIDPVCIRTRGPFADAVIMKGHRHFETSGEEPFRGLVDLLAELAAKKHFRVEVVPDEGRPNHCPGGK
ncbi:MAG: hypothetical protein JW959_02115 [Pirellulales bacterium]|nr:hypothetical protein [Pirellulales bacterium]